MSQTTTIAQTEATVPVQAARYHTSAVPNPDFEPPKDFKFPDGLREVPINPKGPTEVPMKTLLDYDKVEVRKQYQIPTKE